MANRLSRRRLLEILAGLPLMSGLARRASAAVQPQARVRLGDSAWPSEASWNQLDRDVGGRLIKVRSPLADCIGGTPDAACAQLFKKLKNPYYLGDEVGLTQSLGWVGAWTSEPSVYAVAAKTTKDVVAAVNFARTNNLRLVVKGGGHSYQGTSNAPDSLLIWTRHMNAITTHDAFVGASCEGSAPQPAVSIEPGAIWGHAYNEVTTKGGRYVQGGGCMTVGVAGIILGGGFGSFSKAYGTAAASLIEAEVVTADGEIRIANACSNPDLFWALKGGGGGFGVVTRVTVRTHELPDYFGGASATIKAASDDAYRRLIAKTLEFYAEALFNPHWGEQISIGRGYVVISMVFQGLDEQQAEAVWRPFFEWIAASPQDFTIVSAPQVRAAPAARFWDPSLYAAYAPDRVIVDDRPGAPADNIFWAGNLEEAGAVWYAYKSAWLPQSLLADNQRERLADALFAAAKPFGVSLHFNKGLAGATAEAIAAAKDTAMNPAVTDGFALMITGAFGQPAYPDVPGHEPDLAKAKSEAEAVGQSMDEIRKLLPRVGSYVWETDYFQPHWQDAFWGENYDRLLAVKGKYDPDGLFFLHHGVGSEDWSADGFTRVN